MTDVLSLRERVSRLPIFSGRLDSAAQAVLDRAMLGDGGYACLCNVHLLMMAQREPTVAAALESSWRVFADGWPVARAVPPRGVERVPGPDLMSAVVGAGVANDVRHFLFGSTPEILNEASSRLEASYPGARIVGTLSPPNGTAAELGVDELAAAVAKTRPHIIWCALGAPKQELWMHLFANECAPALCIGVGAAVDFHAGRIKRAPTWLQRLGLEWGHRLITEPRRLGRRYATTNLAFVAWVARSLIVDTHRRIGDE